MLLYGGIAGRRSRDARLETGARPRRRPLYRAIVRSLADDIASRPARRGRAACRLARARRGARHRFHDGDARLCRGAPPGSRRGERRPRHLRAPPPAGLRRAAPDLAMNIPPRPADPRLAARLGAAWPSRSARNAGSTCCSRYQAPGGRRRTGPPAPASRRRRLAGAGTERVLVAPGAQAALAAITLEIAGRGDVVLAEGLTLSGYRALCAGLGSVARRRRLGRSGHAARRPRRHDRPPPAESRLSEPDARQSDHDHLAARAAGGAGQRWPRRHGPTIIEDDAYGALPHAPPPALAALAPG